MSRKYFGTDGVRGPYGGPLINEAFAARLSYAAVAWLKGAGERRSPAPRPGEPVVDRRAAPGIGRVLIGRDTRASGASLEAAVARGLLAAGAEAVSLGGADSGGGTCGANFGSASRRGDHGLPQSGG